MDRVWKCHDNDVNDLRSLADQARPIGHEYGTTIRIHPDKTAFVLRIDRRMVSREVCWSMRDAAPQQLFCAIAGPE
jgi:hypothetical protein